jgi:hypothetical protein
MSLRLSERELDKEERMRAIGQVIRSRGKKLKDRIILDSLQRMLLIHHIILL